MLKHHYQIQEGPNGWLVSLVEEDDNDGTISLLAEIATLPTESDANAFVRGLPNPKAVFADPNCRHCDGLIYVRSGRGLCRTCWDQEPIRRRYPIINEFGGNTRNARVREVKTERIRMAQEWVKNIKSGLSVAPSIPSEPR